MKVTEELINRDIKDLYLTAVFYFHNRPRYTIPKIICQALDIKDEKLRKVVEANCILTLLYFSEHGYIKTECIHPVNFRIQGVTFTKKGIDYYFENEHPYKDLFFKITKSKKTIW